MEIREYISGPSKRGAAIVTSLGAIFSLYCIGIVDLKHGGTIFGSGISVDGRYLPALLFILLLAATASWAARLWSERKFQEVGKQQEVVKQAVTEKAYQEEQQAAIRLRDAKKALAARESQILNCREGREPWTTGLQHDPTRPLGERLYFEPNREVTESVWKNYESKRQEFLDAAGANENSAALFKEVSFYENILRHVSLINYIYLPASLSGFALLGGIVKCAPYLKRFSRSICWMPVSVELDTVVLRCNPPSFHLF